MGKLKITKKKRGSATERFIEVQYNYNIAAQLFYSIHRSIFIYSKLKFKLSNSAG